MVPRQGGSTHPWVGYVSGDFEERCFLAMLVAEGEGLGEEVSAGSQTGMTYHLPTDLIPLVPFRRFAGTCWISM